MAFEWSDDKQKKISVINVGKEAYNLKDAAARTQIESLDTRIKNLNSAVLHFKGITETAISDGQKITPITIGDNSSYEPVNGDVVIYKPSGLSGDADTEREYVWVGDETNGKWQEFGSTGALKAFAFADKGEVNVPGAGTVALTALTTESTASTDDVEIKPLIEQGKDLQLTAAKDGDNKDVRGITDAGTAATLKSGGNDVEDVISTATVSGETLTITAAKFKPGAAPTIASSVELATTTVKQQAEYENAKTILRATYKAGANTTLEVTPKATPTSTP